MTFQPISSGLVWISKQWQDDARNSNVQLDKASLENVGTSKLNISIKKSTQLQTSTIKIIGHWNILNLFFMQISIMFDLVLYYDVYCSLQRRWTLSNIQCRNVKDTTQILLHFRVFTSTVRELCLFFKEQIALYHNQFIVAEIADSRGWRGPCVQIRKH